MKKSAFFLITISLATSLFGQSLIEARSSVDWTKQEYKADISLNMNKAGLQMPSGKNSGTGIIKMKMPFLLKDSILSLFVDSENYLGDMVEVEEISLDDVTKIIEGGKHSAEVFSSDGKNLNTSNKINLLNISKTFVKQKYPYNPEQPIEIVSTKPFTGIIIDARGAIPVHGEYISSEVYPCFFPKIWDENMNVIYEKNMVEKNIATSKGIVQYNWSNDFTLYEDIVGFDPFYVKAEKVYGRNRTDPILRKKDALKILTNENNRNLLKQGKVIILLDKKNLVYDIKVPEKTPEYYASFKQVKQYIYKNKVDDIKVQDGLTGILFSVDLKFVPDSPEILPEERYRIRKIAEMLDEIIQDNSFSILIEGHTADLGKPVGQMNLSIERTRTVMKALIEEGIPENLFSYKGSGATKPIAPNDTEEGRAQNRRVEITARPKATYIQRDW